MPRKAKVTAVEWSWRDDKGTWNPFEKTTNSNVEAEFRKGTKKNQIG